MGRGHAATGAWRSDAGPQAGRGGSPTASDRILSARMGEKAVDLLRENQGGLCVGVVKNRIVAVEIDKALSMKRRVDKHLIELADILAR